MTIYEYLKNYVNICYPALVRGSGEQGDQVSLCDYHLFESQLSINFTLFLNICPLSNDF